MRGEVELEMGEVGTSLISGVETIIVVNYMVLNLYRGMEFLSTFILKEDNPVPCSFIDSGIMEEFSIVFPIFEIVDSRFSLPIVFFIL